MYEEFIMSEACSKFYALLGEEDSEAQNLDLHLDYMAHASFCKSVSEVCKDYLKTKNITNFILKLKRLGLTISNKKLVFNTKL